jgi:hypothetical protein
LRSGGSILFASTNAMTETRTYVGTTGGSGGLIFGTSYRGEEQKILVSAKEEGAKAVLVERVVVKLPNGRTTVVSSEQWDKWFKK